MTATAGSLDGIPGGDGILVLPTARSLALRRNAAGDEIACFYRAALASTSIAGHTGLPQVTLPIGLVEYAPGGLSLVARWGADRRLLAPAGKLCRSINVALH